MINRDQISSLRPRYRELEFWACILATARHQAALDAAHLELAFSIGLRYAVETTPAHVKCLALYVIGRALLLLRDIYPEWNEWVACVAIQAGDWALAAGDPSLHHRCEALFDDYIRCIK